MESNIGIGKFGGAAWADKSGSNAIVGARRDDRGNHVKQGGSSCVKIVFCLISAVFVFFWVYFLGLLNVC